MVPICRNQFAESQRALNQWNEEEWTGKICPALRHNPHDSNAFSKLKLPGVKLPLYPYQVSSIWWCLKQERSVYRAGVLGDEMGFGKVSIDLPRRSRISSFTDFGRSPLSWRDSWSSTLNSLNCTGKGTENKDTTQSANTDPVKLIPSLGTRKASRTTFHVHARTPILRI